MRKLRVRGFGDGFTIAGEAGSPDIIFEGDFTVEEIDTNEYVQVLFLNPGNGFQHCEGKLYTYIDPGFGLKVGDLVNVPTVYKPENIAQVKKLGDGFGGRARAEVQAVYQPTFISPDGGLGYDDRIPYHKTYDDRCFCDPSNGDFCC